MRKNYRPEIDGLKGFAIVSIFLFHSQIIINNTQIFRGGHFGFDIFFVITGYLTNYYLLKNIYFNNFKLENFYERKLRRLFPVLLIASLTFFLLAWLYLLPTNFSEFAGTILYSIGFISNFYYQKSELINGTEDALFVPFFHTWSLSVGYQFYILFPLILIFIVKFFKNYLIHFLILGFVSSIVFSFFGSKNFVLFNFYMLPTRLWEFLAGSIVAFIHVKNIEQNFKIPFKSAVEILNLILILILILKVDLNFFYFFEASILITFLTCTLIYLSFEKGILQKIFRSKLLVLLGAMSYSLYIWHYPIFSFGRISGLVSDDIFNKLIIIFSILLFSFFSYITVEKYFYNKSNFKKFKFFLFFLLLSVIFLSVITIKNKGFEKRVPDIFQKFTEEKPSFLKLLVPNDPGSDCYDEKEWCVFNPDGAKSIYLVGDSHMAAISYDLKDKIVNKNIKFTTITHQGCFYFPYFNKISISNNKIDENCNNEYFQRVERELLDKKNSIIIFGGRLPLFLDEGDWEIIDNKKVYVKWKKKFQSIGKFKSIEESFIFSIEKLLRNGNKIILIYPTPEIIQNPKRKLFANIPKNVNEIKQFFEDKNNFISIDYDDFINRSKSSFKMLDAVSDINLYRIYPHLFFCNSIIEKKCVSHDEKTMFYYDDNHLSIEGSKLLNNEILETINMISN